MSLYLIDRGPLKDRPRAGAIALNRRSPLARGVVGWWPLLNDYREVVTGLLPSATAGTLGRVYDPKHGYAWDFGRYDSTARLDYDYNLAPWKCQSFTITGWMYQNNDSGANARFILGRWGAVGAAAWYFGMNVGGGYVNYQLRAGLYDGATAKEKVSTATYSGRLVWRQLGVTFDGITLRWYVDGLQLDSTTDVLVPTTAGTQGVSVGAQNVGTAPGGQPPEGWVTDIVLRNVAYSPGEMWRAFDPSTRWDLYAMPTRRVFLNIPSGAISATPDVGPMTLTGRGVSLGFAINMPDEL